MHSSWLFSGSSSGVRLPANSASGDRSPSSSGSTFEVNSFVRSLNLQGLYLHGGLQFKGVTGNNKREWTDLNSKKSLNELLNVLNESVERVVENGDHQNESKASNFASLGSGLEGSRDLTDLNDLINLVSSTANELRNITNSHNNSQPLLNPVDVGTKNLIHPAVISTSNATPSDSFASDSLKKFNNSQAASRDGSTANRTPDLSSSKGRNENAIDLDDTPTKENSSTPELVDVFPENLHGPSAKRSDVSTGSSEALRYSEKPSCFRPEGIRLAKATGFTDTSSSVDGDQSESDWKPRTRRINFEDELWPISSGINGKLFPPYFAGTTMKAFCLSEEERNFVNESKRDMNSSRSSLIFARQAGECPVEGPEVVEPTRDRENFAKKLNNGEHLSEARSDNRSASSSGISDDIFYAEPPKKLHKIDESKMGDPQTNMNNVANFPEKINSLVLPVANEDKIKKKATFVKVLTKRSFLAKQKNKNTRKKSSSKTECEDTSESSSSSARSGRKSPMQRFLEESAIKGEEKLMTQHEDNADSVGIRIGTSAQICRPDNQFCGKRMETQLSRIAIANKNRIPICRKLQSTTREIPTGSTGAQSDLVNKNQNVVSSRKNPISMNIYKKTREHSFTQPVRKSPSNSRMEISSSCSSVPRQSKITRVSLRSRSNLSEIVSKPEENSTAAMVKSISAAGKNQSQKMFANRGQYSDKKSEAVARIPRSGSKQRPETPKKIAHSEHECLVKSISDLERITSPFDSRTRIARPTNSNFKTTIPVLRSKTFVCQMKREANVRRVVSKEDYSTNFKSSTMKTSQNSSSCIPVNQFSKKPPPSKQSPNFCSNENKIEGTRCESRSGIEQSQRDSQVGLNSNLDKIGNGEYRSSHSGEKRSSSYVRGQQTCDEDSETCNRNTTSKLHNRHAQSLRMFKSILSGQGVNVDREKNCGSVRGSHNTQDSETETKQKILNTKMSNRNSCIPQKDSPVKEEAPEASLEKSAGFAETSPDGNEPIRTDSHPRPIALFADLASPDSDNSWDVSKFDNRCEKSQSGSEPWLEKLTASSETCPVRREPSKMVDCSQKSVTSFDDCTSESTATWRSMRDAEEQCCLHCESSLLSQCTSARSVESSRSRKLPGIMKKFSEASTEIDEDYRRSIYVDAAVSLCKIQQEEKSFEAVETQTKRLVQADKDSATEAIDQPDLKSTDVHPCASTISSATKEVCTESQMLPSAVKDICTQSQTISSAVATTETNFRVPQQADATSQFNPVADTRNISSGRDSSDSESRSRGVNTDRVNRFLRSRGVLFRGPPKVDGASEFDPPEKSKDAACEFDPPEKPKDVASGDERPSCRSEDTNTDRQEHLFEDRSVDALGVSTVEEACQIEPPLSKLVSVSVGKCSLSVHSELILSAKLMDLQGIENSDVQWRSSTNFYNTRGNNGTVCSSNSSLVVWRPKNISKKTTTEKLSAVEDRVPEEILAVLRMADQKAKNLCRAVEIYREVVGKNAEESVRAIERSVEDRLSDDKEIDKESKRPLEEAKKNHSFGENSKIGKILEANLKEVSLEISEIDDAMDVPLEISELHNEAKSAELELRGEVSRVMGDLVENVARVAESEIEFRVCPNFGSHCCEDVKRGKERSVEKKKHGRPAKLIDPLEGKSISEEKFLSTCRKLNLSVFSRNGLLTVIYGTVCSLVFWALQFSITCDSV